MCAKQNVYLRKTYFSDDISFLGINGDNSVVWQVHKHGAVVVDVQNSNVDWHLSYTDSVPKFLATSLPI